MILDLGFLTMMVEQDDWRLHGQERYLKGIVLRWKNYNRPGPSWIHGHCEFCWVEINGFGDPKYLHEGYTTEDEYRWICKDCYEDFKELIEWKLEDSSV